MDQNELLEPFLRLLEDVASPHAVRAIEASGVITELWDAFEQSGFLDALAPEMTGGAGLTLLEVEPLLRAVGRYCAPAPIGETMVARARLAEAGAEIPSGPIVLAPSNGLRTALVPLGGVAQHVLIECSESIRLMSLREVAATATGAHNSLASLMAWKDETSGVAIAAPACGLRAICAVLRASAIAGAADRVLEMTVAYANERVQFGKAIGKHQAVQQQLAVMAEETVAARIASQLGCASGFPPTLAAAAVAKEVASRAAVQIAEIAHAVHGAIGISEDLDLQLFTRRLHEWRLADGSESYWAGQIGALRISAPQSSSLDFVRAIAD